MMVGFYYKMKGWSLENRIYIIPVGFIICFIGTLYWRCGMLSLTWLKVFPYSMSALLGTLMVFAISKLILKNGSIFKNSLIYIGNHTLEILTWHFLSFKLVSLMIIGLYNLSIVNLGEFPVIEDYAYQGWWIVYLIIGVIIPLFFFNYLYTIINRYRRYRNNTN